MVDRFRSRLVEWLDQQITEDTDGLRLPTDVTLAKQFELSRTTVRRILRDLRNRGLLERIPGKGTFVRKASRLPTTVPAKPRSSDQAVADTLAESISSGAIKVGEALPSVKFICRQFGASPQTVSRAYRLLQERGLVVRMGKSFWVGDLKVLTGTPARKTVYLFNHLSDNFRSVFVDDLMARSYERMERELLTCGCRVRYGNTARIDHLLGEITRGMPLPDGAVFHGLDAGRFAAVAGPAGVFIEKMHAARNPVLVDWTAAERPRVLDTTEVLSRGHLLTAVARTLGQFLLRKAHRGACFFYNPDRKEAYAWQGIHLLMRIQAELVTLAPGFAFRIAVSNTSDAREAALQLAQDAGHVSRADVALYRRKYGSFPSGSLEASAVAGVSMQTVRAQLPDIHVWVFLSAAEAAAACDWARENLISVPAELAIVTLRADHQYHHYGITTCEPDWDRTGYVMAHAVIGDIPVRRTTKGLVSTAALLLERQTT